MYNYPDKSSYAYNFSSYLHPLTSMYWSRLGNQKAQFLLLISLQIWALFFPVVFDIFPALLLKCLIATVKVILINSSLFFHSSSSSSFLAVLQPLLDMDILSVVPYFSVLFKFIAVYTSSSFLIIDHETRPAHFYVNDIILLMMLFTFEAYCLQFFPYIVSLSQNQIFTLGGD